MTGSNPFLLLAHSFSIRGEGTSRFLAGILAAGCLQGCAVIYEEAGGPYKGDPADAFKPHVLSSDARDLMNAAFSGFEGEEIHDHHLHFFGNGRQGESTYCPELNSLDPSLRPYANIEEYNSHQIFPLNFFAAGIFLDTVEVDDWDKMDDQYMKRLVDMVSAHGPPAHWQSASESPYRTVFHLMAMDGFYDENGEIDPNSFFYIPNAYVIALADALNARLREGNGFTRNEFRAVGSINPLQRSQKGKCQTMRPREDWTSEIQRLKAREIRWIKWRPPSMALDPELVSNEFYRELAAAEIGILTHTGHSKGIKVSPEYNGFAAPDKMRKALECGVRVGFLHIGRAGEDAGGRSYSEQFFQLLEDYPKERGLVFGELSAIPYYKTAHLLEPTMEKGRGRFIDGSDYPAVTPYVFVCLTLKDLRKRGYLRKEEVKALDEIFRYNPLTFDFVLKRTLRVRCEKLPREMFLGLP